VEKPRSITVHEGRRMVEAARRNDRVVQVGTHRRSSKSLAELAVMIAQGKLGKVTVSQAYRISNMYPAGIGSARPSPPPTDLNWDMWLGPRPKRPFSWHRRRRISPITSSRRYRYGSGLSPCRSNCGASSPTDPEPSPPSRRFFLPRSSGCCSRRQAGHLMRTYREPPARDSAASPLCIASARRSTIMSTCTPA